MGVFIKHLIIGLMFLAVSTGSAFAASEKKEDAPPTIEYYDLMPVTVPVMTDKGVVQQVSVSVSLECAAGKRDKVAAYKPKLMDAYLRELYGALGGGHAMIRGNVVDIEAVKSRLSDVTTRVVGPDMVNEVLLQSVHQYKTTR